MQGSVEWTGAKNMVGITANGQRTEMEWDDGPGPMQITLQMVGACSLVDVILGLKDRVYQDLYHFTVGGPVEDTRLRTLPPYPNT